MFSRLNRTFTLSLFCGLCLVTSHLAQAQQKASTKSIALSALPDVTPQALLFADARLTRKVTLAEKAISFSDLCKRLSMETGIMFTADSDTADDKITLFCRERPLAEILYQIALLFNFNWSRAGEADTYRYTLFQEGYARKAEAELRDGDLDTVFKVLDAQMEVYRPYLNRSLEELEARREQATDKEEKDHLRLFLNSMALPAAAYLSLSRQDKIALFKGETLDFDSNPNSSRRLAPNIARIHIRPQWKRMESGGVYRIDDQAVVPEESEMQANVSFQLRREKQGGYTFLTKQYVTFPLPRDIRVSVAARRQGRHKMDTLGGALPIQDPAIGEFKNAVANADLAKALDMQTEIALELMPVGEMKMSNTNPLRVISLPLREGPVTTMAEALEAFHKATSKDIIADSFARLMSLKSPIAERIRAGRVFDVLNTLADWQQMRWTRREGWLTFRTLEYYKARPQEVPNRLWERWSRSVKENGISPDVLLEIARLTDVQLEGQWNAAIAHTLYGINGWEVVAHDHLQPHWQFLASLPAPLQKAALSEKGVSYSAMPWDCQRRFIELGLLSTPRDSSRRIESGRRPGYDRVPASNDPALKGATFRVVLPRMGEPDFTFTRFIYRYGKPIQGNFQGREFTRNKFRVIEAGDK